MIGIDLLRQDKKWKEALMDIRHLMADLVQKVRKNIDSIVFALIVVPTMIFCIFTSEYLAVISLFLPYWLRISACFTCTYKSYLTHVISTRAG